MPARGRCTQRVAIASSPDCFAPTDDQTPAHCEVEPNWLVPLVEPMVHDYRICTVPMVDAIDGATYVFSPQAGGDENNFARGAWDWDLLWKRIPLNNREKVSVQEAPRV